MHPPWRTFLYALLPLIFSAQIVTAAPTDVPSAASFYVPTLPSLSQDPSHPLHIYAGHISSDPNAPSQPSTTVTAHVYFVLVKARRTADKERVVFWFNGGPGCSSFDGLMMEVGPWRIDGKGGLKVVEGGWEEYTHMVFIDQPAGTGFSYTSTDRYVHELTEASSQMIEFWSNFYKIFPEFLSMDTYLAGESYAGQYIPYFADAIMRSNLHIPLKGVAIGNGWMDGRNQYPSFLDYAVKHGLIEVGSDSYKTAKGVTDSCLEELKKLEGVTPEPINVGICENVMMTVLEGREHEVDGKWKCTNVYDVRLEDDKPSCGMNWPPDLPDVTTYLGRQDVIRALHATAKPTSWTECTGRVGQELYNRQSASSITLIPGLMDRWGLQVLLFAGDQDFICNYVGVEGMINRMEWSGGVGLGTVQTRSWSVNGMPAGTWVESRNLTYAKIFNASHMVGFDVPHVSHDMMLRFMGMNFSAIVDGSARIPSSVGGVGKPAFSEGDATSGGTGGSGAGTGKSPEQDKAMWEAYYNAGSAALVLVLVLLFIGTFLWCRTRRSRIRIPAGSIPLRQGEDEESIPLTRNGASGGEFRGRGKGKERERERDGEEREEEEGEREGSMIFDVGESDEEKWEHEREER
ncbi:hypothetical protein JAAARDRAFT_166238 [Jaapia argillacea MUCL 33604]|uniref:Carboxypeptidase n=1 Tax=Jaapia argillacea MUCL 33604 TaxID=933084 RepID=A0A067QAX2_9AGAM|nr:hypothetical protein JAAARDRAFT_166238 [Jaapia argillacea MUCL 33604]